MKIKKLLIISLILSILAIGAVSASQTPDNLTVEDTPDEEISIVDEDVLTDDSVSTYIYNKYNTNPDDGDTLAYVDDDDYLNGAVTLSIDGKQYYNKVFSKSDRKDTAYIKSSALNLPNSLMGKHSVTLSYLKNGVTPYSSTKTVEFEYCPSVNYHGDIAAGEPAVIHINGLAGTSGTATIYYYKDSSDENGLVVSTGRISNGKCQMTIKGLAKGESEYVLKMTINGREFSERLFFDVEDNTAGYSARVTPTVTVGNNGIVTFSGSKTNGRLYIYVDGVNVKSIRYYGGTLSETIGGLSVGTHIISVEYSKGDDFYHKSFNVKVVPKKISPSVNLALKKVTVKKSAKKLPLTATLKINKKAAKGKKITFNFNGKKYTAKTNKKGVAKVSIKSPVLKKLKAGKKVTYRATYNKKTIKQTATVKK